MLFFSVGTGVEIKMSISVEWDDQFKRKLIASFRGYWTWEDYREAVDTIHSLMQSHDHEVDLMVDLTHSAKVPVASLRENIDRLNETLGTLPRTIRMILVVHPESGKWARAWMAKLVLNLSQGGHEVIGVESLDQAYATIGRRSLLTA